MTAALLDVKPANWTTVEAAGAGDRDAFALLYQGYRWRVFNFLRYRCHDNDLAEDLTSDVFLRAMTRLDTVTWQGRDIGAWLITTARNILIDHMKSAAHRTTVPVAGYYDTDLPWTGTDHNPAPEDAAVRADLDARLRVALPLLTADQQRVIGLRFYLQQSVTETAAAMGLNEGAVKALQYRATNSLRRLLEGLDL